MSGSQRPAESQPREQRELTVADVMRRLKCSRRKVYALINSNALAAFDTSAPGSRKPDWRIDADDFEAFKRERKTMQRPPRRKRAQPTEVRRYAY